jgi:hypothetical protein
MTWFAVIFDVIFLGFFGAVFLLFVARFIQLNCRPDREVSDDE